MSHPLDIQNAIALLHAEGYEIKDPPKKEKIECFRVGIYSIDFSQPIPSEKFPQIKSAIEQILNDEQPKDDRPCYFDEEKLNKRLQELKGKQNPTQLTHEYVTLEECERRERRAFHGAKFGMKYRGAGVYYESFDDYKKQESNP